MTVDPYWKLLPHESPYNFVANSPIRYKDKDGRILSAANATSWKEMYNAVQQVFSKNDALKAIFKQDGET